MTFYYEKGKVVLNKVSLSANQESRIALVSWPFLNHIDTLLEHLTSYFLLEFPRASYAACFSLTRREPIFWPTYHLVSLRQKLRYVDWLFFFNSTASSIIMQVGENGQGKTTFLKLLRGDLEPVSGLKFAHRWRCDLTSRFSFHSFLGWKKLQFKGNVKIIDLIR